MMDEFCSVYRVKAAPVTKKELESTADLLFEEANELLEEANKPVINTEDSGFELVDSIYVAAQRLRRMGFDVDGMLAAKHASNMSKTVSRAHAAYELQVARERYPEAYIDEGQNYCVLRDAATNKVIKPTSYTKAKAKQEHLPHA